MAWALAAGGTLRTARVQQDRCFETFPFPPTTPASPPPSPTASAPSPNNSTPTARPARPRTIGHADGPVQRARQAALGRALNAKRKTHPRPRPGRRAARAARRARRPVLQAYGWGDLGAGLADHGRAEARAAAGDAARTPGGAERQARRRRSARQGALAAPRVPERARAASAPAVPVQEEIEQEAQPAAFPPVSPTSKAGWPQSAGREPAPPPWPATLPEQVRAVADALAAASGALDETLLAEAFTGRGPWKKRLPG